MNEKLGHMIKSLAANVSAAREYRNQRDEDARQLRETVERHRANHLSAIVATNKTLAATLGVLRDRLEQADLNPVLDDELKTSPSRPHWHRLATLSFEHSSAGWTGKDSRVFVCFDVESNEEDITGLVVVSYWVGQADSPPQTEHRVSFHDFDEQKIESLMELALEYVVTRIPYDATYPSV